MMCRHLHIPLLWEKKNQVSHLSEDTKHRLGCAKNPLLRYKAAKYIFQLTCTWHETKEEGGRKSLQNLPKGHKNLYPC